MIKEKAVESDKLADFCSNPGENLWASEIK